MHTLKYALRTLLHSPFVTAVAVLSLALGIGANSAIFSMFDQIMLRSLPVEDPGRLVNLGAPGPKPGSQSCGQAGGCDVVFSYPMFRDLEREQKVFTGIAAHRVFGANLGFEGQTESAGGVLVSGSYFPVLGLRPALGRLLGPTDDQPPGEPHVVVLGYDYWIQRFAGRTDILNATLVINGQPMSIVGVAPEGFAGTTLGSRPRVYVPITMRRQMEQSPALDNRTAYWAYLFARLKPGVSIEEARAGVNVPYHAIITTVEAPLQRGMSEATLARFNAKVVTVEPGRRGQSDIHEEALAPMVILMSATGIVLLIACANIANLLLARSAARTGEMAVRLSIGASRWHLVRQLLVESCVMAGAGAAVGLLVARWTLSLLASLLPADASTTFVFGIRPAVVWWAGALALGTGVLFGLFPALHSTRPDLAATLKGVAGQPSGARSAARFRKVLIVAQIALSTMLLAMAALFLKSLVLVSRAEIGIAIDHLVVFGISPRLNGYTPERTRDFLERLEAEFGATPGVTGVTVSLVPLIAGSNWGTNLTVQGFDAGPDTDTHANYNEVSPGFFRTLGIPLLAGREFTIADHATAPKVAIVNEAFLRKFNLGRDAVGKRMRQGRGGELNIEIVGISRDAKYSEVKDAIPAQFVTPFRQDSALAGAHFYVRTAADPEAFIRTVPAIAARLDPNLPVEDLRTMPQQVRDNTFLDRMISTLAGAFASLATVLAAIGLYGVMAYTVTQRTREFGLRMALGADPARVRRLVLGQVGWLMAWGLPIGVALALLLGYFAQAMLFEMKGHDPSAFAGAVGLLAVVALAAGLVPALRASRVDPMRALRYE